MRNHPNLLTLLVIFLTVSPLANADGHHGGHHGGGHFGGHHRSGFSIGLYAGNPYYAYPYYYNNPYAYGSSYYYNPPVIVTPPPAPPVYIEQSAPVQQQAPDNYWYYCNDPQGYYPYVRECKTQWQTVEPVPPSK